MSIKDFPKTHRALKAKQKQIDLIPLDSTAALIAINKVRADLSLNPISTAELVLATLPRLEDKLNEESEVRTQAWTESSEEQSEPEASQKKEVDLTH
jgi:hypothetical protein